MACMGLDDDAPTPSPRPVQAEGTGRRGARVRSWASASARDWWAFGALRASASWIAFAMRRSFWRSEGALSVSLTTSRTSQSTCLPCLSAPRRVAKPMRLSKSSGLRAPLRARRNFSLLTTRGPMCKAPVTPQTDI